MYICFVYNKIPTTWLKTVIIPIPKSSTKDPCIPIFQATGQSHTLNFRIAFRSQRSYQYHLYTLITTITRNKQQNDDSTFAAFETTFDWVNHEQHKVSAWLSKRIINRQQHGGCFDLISLVFRGICSFVISVNINKIIQIFYI